MLASPVVLLRRLPPAVRILVAGTFVNRAGTFILPYLTLVLTREMRLSGGVVAALVSAYGAGSLLSILAGGALTDRMGRRATLLVSLIGSGVLAVAMGFAPSVRHFVPLLVLFAFVADLYRPAAAAIISDLVPSRDRAVGYAALRLAVNLGFAVGTSLGGFLADWNWRVLFLADGATTLAFGAIVYFLVAETRPVAAPRAERAEPQASVSPWRDGVFLQVSLASLLFCTLLFVDFIVLPLTVTLSAGYPSAVFGALLGTNGLLIAVFELPLVQYLQRFRRLKVAALGVALSGIAFGMTGLVMHWAWFLLSIVLWTVGEILAVPQQNAFVADWAPPEARGRYLALYHATWSLGFSIAPAIFLPLHARLPEAAFWPLLTLVAIPPALMLLRFDRTVDRPERLRGLAEETPLPALAAELVADRTVGGSAKV